MVLVAVRYCDSEAVEETEIYEITESLLADLKKFVSTGSLSASMQREFTALAKEHLPIEPVNGADDLRRLSPGLRGHLCAVYVSKGAEPVNMPIAAQFDFLLK